MTPHAFREHHQGLSPGQDLLRIAHGLPVQLTPVHRERTKAADEVGGEPGAEQLFLGHEYGDSPQANRQ